MAERQTWLVNIDLVVFCLYLFLVTVGWYNIYSVTYEGQILQDVSGFLQSPVGRQTIWIGISLVVFGIIMIVPDWRIWSVSAYGVYALSILLLVLVLVMGTEIKGARSWFIFGGASFQPSEIAKFGTCLAMAAFLSHWNNKLNKTGNQLIAISLFVLPILLILLQPDAGSALIFLSMFIVLYREGMPAGIYILGAFSTVLLLLGIYNDTPDLVIGLLLFAYLLYSFSLSKTGRKKWLWPVTAVLLAAGCVYFFQPAAKWYFIGGLALLFIIVSLVQYKAGRVRLVGLMVAMVIYGSGLAFAANYAFNNVLLPHQQERINVWLKLNDADPSGAAYNVMNSRYAIASGSWLGKGWGEGNVTKGRFVPEQSTDFIFCTVGEESGFVGSAALLLFFLALLLRLVYLAERQRFAFARIYIYGVASIIFFHVFVNIGMTMGLMPVIGIPLPFISKGGSSLLGFTVMLAVALKMDKHRKQRVKVRNFGVRI